MAGKGHALARDELVRVLTAYSGVATADGAADGSTLIDSNLIGRNDFVTEKGILIMSGDAKDEDKGATSFNTLTGTITLQGTGFSAQIKAGTIFRILNISSVEIDVAAIDTKIGTNTDPAGTTTLFAWLANIFSGAGGISAIFALVNAMLVLTETGGTILTDGTEQDVYINNAPAGVFEPRKVMLDFSVFVRGAENHGSQATETIVVRTYYRIYPGGNFIKKDEVTFVGILDPALINIELEPNRYGVEVTMERTGGNARYYDWEALYSA